MNIAEFISKNKSIFIVISIGLFLIELELFALAAINSGRESWLKIKDSNGTLIYETDGENLNKFNKYYFERTFGPFENYEFELEVKENPFPFKAWFVAALGVPIGIVLLLAFIFKAYLSVFSNETSEIQKLQKTRSNKNISIDKLDAILDKIERMNIFVIGFLAFIAIIGYWLIPDILIFIGRIGVETFDHFKWFFIFFIVVFFSASLWIIYLRYSLARINIENRKEIEKYKIQLQLTSKSSFEFLNQDDMESENIKVKHLNNE